MECEHEDDIYGHSIEDDYCISPGTAAQFTFDRNQGHSLSAFMSQDDIPEEEEGSESDSPDPLNDSRNYRRPLLNDVDEARLNSCLDGIRDVMGEAFPEHVLVEAVLSNGFNIEKALNALLTKQSSPVKEKPPEIAQEQRKFRDSSDITKNLSLDAQSIQDIKTQNTNTSNANNAIQSGLIKPKKLDFWGGLKPDSPVGNRINTKAPTSTSNLSLAKTQPEIQNKGGKSVLSQLASQHTQNTTDGNSVLSQLATRHFQAKDIGQQSTLSQLTGAKLNGSPALFNLPNQQSTSNSSGQPSLSQLASLHSKTSKSGNSTLSHLAAQHLESNVVGGPSLSQLAGQHSKTVASSQLQFLQSPNPTLQSKTQGESNLFQNMSVLRPSPQVPSTGIKDVVTKSSDVSQVIDLTSAVRKKDQRNLTGQTTQSSIKEEPKSLMFTKIEKSLNKPAVGIKLLLSELPKNISKYCSKPSQFGKTIVCSHCGKQKPGRTNNRQLKKFRFAKQMTKNPTAQNLKHIKLFDFSTPSPDDIVKEKQKGAFGKQKLTDRTNLNTEFKLDKPPAGDDWHQKNIQVKDNEIEVKANDLANGSEGVRMTFSKTATPAKGFTLKDNDKKAGLGLAGGDSDNVDSDKEEKVRNANVEASPLRGSKAVDGACATPGITRSVSRTKQDKVDVQKEIEKRKTGKELLNLVVIGHVDAGKSTLMGHLLYQLGFVNKKLMHKYEQDSKKIGKASFAYAWVLDETEEERSRGVTMDIAQTRFETDNRIVTLLDAPGHKDFIPNMITGAAQADVAIMVVNATKGEFETGFEAGGQTREHALLVRSLGVSQLAVVVNKMDTIEWSRKRFDEVTQKMKQFLKQAGFKEAELSFIPCSGLGGENLTRVTEAKLQEWYKGPTLLEQIDKFKAPERLVNKPFRMCVSDVFKGMGSGFSISGRLEAGSVQAGDKVVVMPAGETATVKSVTIDEVLCPCALAGDNAIVTVTGIDMSNVHIGSILCDPANPIKSATRIKARVVIFNIEVPITKGFPVVLHYQTLNEPATIRKLISQLHKSTGEVVKKKPRCLTKNMNAVIEIEVGRPICIEMFRDYKDLGRFMLRYSGMTIAAGLVTEIIESKANMG
ncbi:HBS1-like protein [Lingula anatina]|uniref:HBS1-like protein n=1 Tax=Lingula anatina TaxID=7574 RepID=A0A1S3JX08_LINAN|nr:HBS1-like protein [Lingula anatina]|eukprot:XP_013414569.1 HBS1-like protein [Lingula anatina]